MLVPKALPSPLSLPKQGYAAPSQFGPSAAPGVEWAPWHDPQGLLYKLKHVVASVGW